MIGSTDKFIELQECFEKPAGLACRSQTETSRDAFRPFPCVPGCRCGCLMVLLAVICGISHRNQVQDELALALIPHRCHSLTQKIVLLLPSSSLMMVSETHQRRETRAGPQKCKHHLLSRGEPKPRKEAQAHSIIVHLVQLA